MTKDRLETVLAAADAGMGASLDRLFELIRIPSISTEPAHREDCRRAADWLEGELLALGFEASVRPTAGHPMVVAHDRTGDGPHVLFYGHYDVQPVDPIGLWKTKPFEPVLVPQPGGDSHIVARGASDDKGQLLTFVEACRAWKNATGSLPVRVSMLFEGEEEISSPNLIPFLEANKDDLFADLMLVCDTDMWDERTPAITTMLRGLVEEEIDITTADRDLHSGMFGSAARNANQLLAEILSSLRGPDGSVNIDGFYDGVAELPEEVRAMWNRLPFDGEKFLADIGLSIPAGEQGRSVLEQVWARPTCEVNGMWGGYTGEGFKTVIPAKAHAKISFRLVAGQDPEKVRAAFRAHVEARVPADCSVTFINHGGSAATVIPVDNPFLQPALTALAEEWDGRSAVAGTGGSIPIVGEFKQRLGMDALLVGFARFDNRIHSPNEKYDLSSFRKGIRSWVRILAAFADRR
ncbi:MAG: dipeptidase [Rhizobiaceae bacterium]